MVLTCSRCHHAGEVDLLALQVAGKGDRPILAIYDAQGFACSRCGGKLVNLRVA